MPIEFMGLVAALAVLAALVVIGAVAGVMQYGVVAQAGARDGQAPPSPFLARARRAIDNHIENLVLFAPLVLMAAHLEAFSAATVLGAQLFAGGRVAHAVFYLLGAPWVRTIAFVVSTTGMILVALALFRIA